MKIEHQTKEDKGRFVLTEEGQIRGQLVYTQRHNEIVIQHTEVDQDLRGQNFGNELVEEAVTYARSNGLKVQPVCAFARALFKTRKDFEDVLAI